MVHPGDGGEDAEGPGLGQGQHVGEGHAGHPPHTLLQPRTSHLFHQLLCQYLYLKLPSHLYLFL